MVPGTMRCTKCEFENPAGMNFCGKCRTALGLTCPSCSFDNPPGFEFCGKCAAALGEDTGIEKAKPALAKPVAAILEVAKPAQASALEGERKTVTALFADITGSTELEQDLDPEEARAIVDPALKLMIEAVQRFDGYIVQSTGDGIFALFGAPVAHEDHPQRGLYAALRMQEELRKYSASLREAGNAPLEARVGVNSGEVVIRSITTGTGHTEYTPIGHTANLASRMQVLAPTGSIAISEQTRKLVEGYFLLKPLGPTKVKGVSEPVNVYEVTGLGPLRTRLQRSAGRGFTKFVGREREIDAMEAAADRAKSGRGQIVAAIAEAGTGKSRLFFEFKAKNQSGWMVLEAFSVSHGKASAFLPVIDLLHGYFRIAADDDARTRREKVNGRIVTLDPALEDTRPYLFGLLGIVGDDDPLAQMDGKVRKRRTLDAIKRVMLRESLNQPLMVVFEDLHWIDEETQAFLNLLADSIGTAKILLLFNYRPEYSHQWGSKTYYTQLRLDPLGKESAEEMLATLLGDGAEMAPLKRVIIEKTEGNPFFMEETAQVLFDEGVLLRDGASVRLTKPMNALKIPPTVQGILAARIDRLPAGTKELLQSLAVIGREFPLSLVREVFNQPTDQVEKRLSELQLGEFIYEQPASGDIEYTFKHALTQEVAYNSILIERRKQIHESIGAALESLRYGAINEYLAALAHHYGRSANHAKAIEYSSRAADHAAQTFDYSGAVLHLERALELATHMSDADSRSQIELKLLISLAQAQSMRMGVGSEEVGRAYERARQLAQRCGSEPQKFAILRGLAEHYDFVARLDDSRELGAEALALAEKLGDPGARILAHIELANTHLVRGELSQSRKHRAASVTVFKTYLEKGQTMIVNPDLEPFLSWTLWFLGYPDKAQAQCEANLRIVSDAHLPYYEALGVFAAAQVALFRGEIDVAARMSKAASDSAVQRGFSYQAARAKFQCGAVRAQGGQWSEGLREMRSGAQAIAATGARVRSYQFAAMAEACARLNLIEEGLQYANEGLAAEAKTHERIGRPELYRVRSELMITRVGNAGDGAEADLMQAIGCAREQDAKSWELRATTSLARLLNKQGRREEARAMLAEIYNWFTEGFDTADLKDAKALLDELNN